MMGFPSWTETLKAVSDRMLAVLPTLLVSGSLLVLGWILARTCSALVNKVLAKILDRFVIRFERAGSLRKSNVTRAAPRTLARFVYWAVLLFFAAAALEKLPLPVFTELFEKVAYFLPKVLLAVAIVFFGSLAGSFAHDRISDIAAKAGIGHPEILGRMAQVSSITVALIIGVQQVGLEGGLFVSLTTVILGAILGGMALAFGLGSGPVVTNLMASYHLAKAFRIGDSVRIADVEGTIREIAPTAIVVDTGEDLVHVPAKRYCEELTVLIGGER